MPHYSYVAREMRTPATASRFSMLLSDTKEIKKTPELGEGEFHRDEYTLACRLRASSTRSSRRMRTPATVSRFSIRLGDAKEIKKTPNRVKGEFHYYEYTHTCRLRASSTRSSWRMRTPATVSRFSIRLGDSKEIKKTPNRVSFLFGDA